MKRLTALVMAAVMVLPLVGCGGSGGEVPLGGNYWGTTDDRAIGLQIVDYSDFPAAYAMLNYKPILESAPENTFPFVTDLTIFNKVGEEVTFLYRTFS